MRDFLYHVRGCPGKLPSAGVVGVRLHHSLEQSCSLIRAFKDGSTSDSRKLFHLIDEYDL